MDKKKEKSVNEVLFSKDQILKSNKFKDNVDILNCILKDDEKYKISDVYSKIKDFLNKEVV